MHDVNRKPNDNDNSTNVSGRNTIIIKAESHDPVMDLLDISSIVLYNLCDPKNGSHSQLNKIILNIPPII